MKNDNKFSLWNAVRLVCLIGGIALLGAAYLAAGWLESYISVDVAKGLGLLLLLALPAMMIIRLGGSRLRGMLRGAGRRAAIDEARAQLPAWAKRRGLTFEPASQAGELGSVRGRLDGFPIFVDPDAGDIAARFRADLPANSLDISTTEPPAFAAGELQPFETGDAPFDAAFQTRLATDAVAPLFSDSAAVRSAMLDFWNEHADALQAMNVDDQGVVCFLEPDSQYATDVLTSVVDDLVEALELLDEQFATPGAP